MTHTHAMIGTIRRDNCPTCLDGKCRACKAVIRTRIWRDENLDRAREKERVWKLSNASRRPADSRAYRKANLEKIKIADSVRYSRPETRWAYYRRQTGCTDRDRYMRHYADTHCAVTGMPWKSQRDHCIDHDHSTLIIRGSLCNAVNKALGCARDQPFILQGWIDYLGSARPTYEGPLERDTLTRVQRAEARAKSNGNAWSPEQRMRAGGFLALKSCVICGVTGKRLVLDHEHRTGLVRGALCNNCNSGLGAMEERIDWIESAIRYLERGHN